MCTCKKYIAVISGIIVLIILNSQSYGATFEITCEEIACTSSGSQGATRYEYTIKNTSDSTQTIPQLEVGAYDLDSSNYSNWTSPSGMSAEVGKYSDLSGTPSEVYTSGDPGPDWSPIFTPHSQNMPGGSVKLPGAIQWTGSHDVAAQGTVVFGFDNPHPPMDAEWGINSTLGWSQANLPMANPSTFTLGYVHTPMPEPATGVLLLLATAGIILFGRKE